MFSNLKRNASLQLWASLISIMGLQFGQGAIFADWPEFRGPSGQGHSEQENLPLAWSESESIGWKQEIPGISWASPVIAQGKIFLSTAIDVTPEASDENENPEQTINLGAICLDEQTGEKLWVITLFTQVGEVEFHKKNSHASPTPIIDGDQIYFHYGPHGTACVDISGNTLWSRKLEYSPTHGNGGSPALVDDLLVFCCDGHDLQYSIALDKNTGDVRWKTDRSFHDGPGFSFSTPLIVEINGTMQAICPASGAVYGYEAATGKEIWRFQYPGGYSVIPRPVYGNGLVYICTGYMKPTLLAIDPTGTGDVTETHLRWKTEKQVPHSASLLLIDENLFFVSDKGIARCVDALTGETHWEERIGGNFSASPLYAAGRIYFQNEEGLGTVIAASTTFEVLAKNRITEEERTFASYAVNQDSLFIRSERHLFKID
ncbi:PQQ-binding-like beta-propeller repeat protein [Planctomicrobium sp. SH668]|uniref:outer membrane protein assembly factor BamB family protein n=1 Tax=Planctomicrobium sp. SH668 TaxID=3448126 RepID=UPI003F5AE875